VFQSSKFIVVSTAHQNHSQISYIAFPSVIRYAHSNSLFPVPYSLKPETFCLTIMRIAISLFSYTQNDDMAENELVRTTQSAKIQF
jgi:hypothetical protein